MRKDKPITKALTNAVIARGYLMLQSLLSYNAPRQSPATKHDVRQPLRLVRFTSQLRGLLPWQSSSVKEHNPPTTAKSTNSHRQAWDCFVIQLREKLRFIPRNDRYLGKVFVISYLLFHISYLATAQTAYTGGPGDGHALGELQLRQVTVNELTTNEGYYIYPSLAKAGENIYLTSPVAGEFTLVDLTGRIIYTQTFETPAQQLPIPVTNLGLCIGILRTVEGTFTQKIIVAE